MSRFLWVLVVVCWGCAPTDSISTTIRTDAAPTLDAGSTADVRRGDGDAAIDVGVPVTWLPSDIAPTWAWYNADSFPYTTTPRWGDDGNNGKGLYAPTSATSMVYVVPTFTGVSGSAPLDPSWSFGTDGGPLTPAWSSPGAAGWQTADGTQSLVAYHASDWTFLHDGTGAFLSLVFEINAGTATQALFSTCTAAAGPGMYVQADAVSRRVVVVIRNGAGEIYRYDGAVGSVPHGVPTQLTIAFATGSTPDVSVWLDGTLVNSGDLTGAVSVADPAGPLTLAAYADGSGKAIVSFQNEVFWKLIPTAGQITSVLDNFRYVGSQREDLVVWPVGESTTNDPSYRAQLFFRFSQDSRFRPRFVGDAISSNNYTLPVDANKDDGYSGSDFSELLPQIVASSVNPATGVDEILYMEGLNDMNEDMTNPTILAAAYARDALCMAAIVAKAPIARRWLITPNITVGSTAANVVAFNAGLQAFGLTQGWPDYIDLMAGPYALVPSDIGPSNIHPTSAIAPSPPNAGGGYQKMGNTIGDAFGLQNAVP